MVSSIGTISYACARQLAVILSPLVGKTEHHVRNSKQFVDEVRGLKLEPDEELRSYDVTALFTSVPVDKARSRLEEDETLADRTALSPDDIITLLDRCLKCTYFLFQDKYYLQIHGAAMGSPVSLIVCNLYMEDFEQRALATANPRPRWWRRYADDTHNLLKKDKSEEFTKPLNSIDDDIKGTSEGETVSQVQSEDEDVTTRTERSLAFLDTVTVVKEDGNIKTKVFRNATHTDQYLNFDSNHPLEFKRGAVRTLVNRAESIVSDSEDRNKERQHVKKALKINGYPDWTINSVETKLQHRERKQETSLPSTDADSNPSNEQSTSKFPVVIG